MNYSRPGDSLLRHVDVRRLARYLLETMKAVADLGKSMRWFYSSFSALDKYHRRSEHNIAYVTVFGDIVTLARAIPDLEFPGVAHADAAAHLSGRRVYFRCVDEGSKPAQQTFRALNLLTMPNTIDTSIPMTTMRRCETRYSNQPASRTIHSTG